MGTRYITWSLIVVFLVPLGTLFIHTARHNQPFEAIILISFTLVPLIGLRSKQVWFFYYIYVISPGSLIITVCFSQLVGLFSGYDSILAFLALWPIELYFVIVVVMVALLHKRIATQNRAPVG
jgi:hypothetical protein